MQALTVTAKWSFFAIKTLMFIASTSMTDMAIGAPHGTMTIPLALISPQRFRNVQLHLDVMVASFDGLRKRGT